MLSELGLAGRLVLILLLVVIGAMAISAGIGYVVRSRDTQALPRVPLPDQAAAIVGLLDTAEPAQRSRILRAVNSAGVRVSISREPPAASGQLRRLPGVEWLVGQYLEALPDRDVRAVFEPTSGYGVVGAFIERLSPGSRPPLRIAAELRGGDWVVIETRGSPSLLILGLPPGFWIGALGSLLAAVAVWAVRREARPVGALSSSVASFAGDAVPRPVAATGAPDVRALIAATNDMQSRIAALLQARSALLGGISHDLRTFATRLRLRVEAIPDDVGRDKAVRDLDDMMRLLDDALLAARGRTASRMLETIDLGALIAGEVGEWPTERMLFESGANLHVRGDAVALRRVAANLIGNALRYGRRAEVRIAARERDVVLTIDDDGPGIPVAERLAVFEPFYRVETSRNQVTGGFGLGLTIAREIVLAHGGDIRVDSAPLGGARLEVALPRLEV